MAIGHTPEFEGKFTIGVGNELITNSVGKPILPWCLYIRNVLNLSLKKSDLW